MGETTRIWMDDQDGLIIVGDILDGLEHLDDNSVEAVICDPPYDLLQASRKGSGRSNNPDSPAGRHGTKTGGFMGMAWDATGVAFDPKTWEACLRVLKPGGHLLAFGGGRTHHRLWCAVEDAGFELRDTLMYLHGQGFPKSLDVSKAIDKAAGAEREVVGTVKRWGANASGGRGNQRGNQYQPTEVGATKYDSVTAPATDAAKQWDGWGTALKPAVEPILLARKPLSEPTVAANVLKWGTGALAIDATRIDTDWAERPESWKRSGYGKVPTTSMFGSGGTGIDTSKGRWPANVIFECTCDDPQPLPEKARKRKGEPAQQQLDGSDTVPAKPETPQGTVHQPDCPAGMLDAQSGTCGNNWKKNYGEEYAKKGRQYQGGSFGGGGYEGGTTYNDSGGASRFFYCPKASRKERGEGNTHPTVKPLALMRWLVRLVTPPDGIVLDPFCGSGSTLVAAVEEGHGFVGIDLSPEYCATAQHRVEETKRG